jgi:hypothetical protein
MDRDSRYRDMVKVQTELHERALAAAAPGEQ